STLVKPGTPQVIDYVADETLRELTKGKPAPAPAPTPEPVTGPEPVPEPEPVSEPEPVLVI
ncbi:MAG: hypothetical protein LBD62_00735, partial [Candidatus Margulisbacteria bacterium]|nr:hypothetical protein [Candidatus Margulisiibacteriota bacterium]